MGASLWSPRYGCKAKTAAKMIGSIQKNPNPESPLEKQMDPENKPPVIFAVDFHAKKGSFRVETLPGSLMLT